MALEAELKYFEARRMEWVTFHEGKWVSMRAATSLVGSTDSGRREFVISLFDSSDEAYRAGVERWGIVPFLVKQVLKEDRVEAALRAHREKVRSAKWRTTRDPGVSLLR